MTEGRSFPLPEVTEANAPFWEGCERGELRLQVCSVCGTYRFPDSSLCPACLSRQATWKATSGRGTVWSWVRFHQQYFPAAAERLPYVALFVNLEEGPRMISGFDGNIDQLAVDLRVRVTFTHVEGGRHIPTFQPA